MTGKARILFVDDEKRVLNSMRGLFRRHYELFLATEGVEAVRIAAENDIDVIVADQRMPGMTGIEVLAKIKEHSPRTVRILLTGYADPSAIEGSINVGEVFRFLSKPCPPKMLRETLTLAIEASKTNPVAAEPTASPPPAKTAPEAAEPPPAAAPATPAPAAPPATAVAPLPPTPTMPPVAGLADTPKPEQPAPVAAAESDRTESHPIEPDGEQPTVSDSDDTQPALRTLSEDAIAAGPDESSSHWQSVTNVVMSEDSVEETQENVALTSSTLGHRDVGVVVFTVDSDFAATAIRAVSAERATMLATTLVKVAQAIDEQNAGVLVTDFTTNKTILQKIIGALKQHMPELVTIAVSDGRDSNDMINLINYGQIFRYIVKPVEPDNLLADINAAVIRHLYLLNNPESVKRHQVNESSTAPDASESLNQFIGKIRSMRTRRADPTDTIT